MKNNRKDDDAVLPPITVGGRIKNIVKDAKSKLYKYDIFIIVVLEIISLFVTKDMDYVLYVFPFLNYITIYILLRTIIAKSNYLKHCIRKKLAYKVISYYYLFGLFSIIFQIGDNIYSTVVGNCLLLVTIVLVLMSFFKKNE